MDSEEELGPGGPVDPKNGPTPVIRRADDFKRTFVDNFNIGLSQQTLDVSIITDAPFGGTRWAENNLGYRDQGSANMEIVEEQQIVMTPSMTKEFIRILIQSLLRKSELDRINGSDEDPSEQELQQIQQLSIDPEKFEQFFNSFREDILNDVYEE